MSSQGPERTAIAIMARSPAAEAHTIKTRLRTVVPDDKARALLYRAFLADTITLARRVPDACIRLAYTPEGGSLGFDELGVAAEELMEQRGNDLGARERSVFEDLFAEGFARVVVMGSDFPTLSSEVLGEATATLLRDPSSIVLGPAIDGGYYAIGLAAPVASGMELPELFSGIRWSTPHTLTDTLARAAMLGRPVTLLPEWFDVDDRDGWNRLTASLSDPTVAARAPHTATAVAAIGATSPS